MDNIKMIKKKVMGNFSGLMEKGIEDSGKMENKMGKGSFIFLVKIRGKKEDGKMEKELL